MNLRNLKNIITRIENSIDIFDLVPSAVFYYLFFLLAYFVIMFFRLPAKGLLSGTFIFSWRTILFLLIGMVCMIGGDLAGIKIFTAKLLKSATIFLKREWSARRGYVVIAVLSVINLAVKAIWILNNSFFYSHIDASFASSNFYSTVGFFSSTGTIALAIAFAFYFKAFKNKESVRVWQWLVWALFIIEFAYGFIKGSRTETLVPIFVYLIIRHYILGADYKRTLAVILVSLAIIMPAIHFYTSQTKTLDWYFAEGATPSNVVGFSLDSSVGRIQQYNIFYNIFEKPYPGWKGKDLVQFFLSFMPPKFIWHDKPNIVIDSNAFGREFGIINPDDHQSSVGATLVGDWYLNFGLLGIIFGMFFTGLAFRFIYFYLVKATAYSLSGVMIYGVIWLQIIKGLETWIGPLAAGVLKTLIFLLIIHLFLTSRKAKVI